MTKLVEGVDGKYFGPLTDQNGNIVVTAEEVAKASNLATLMEHFSKRNPESQRIAEEKFRELTKKR